MNTRNFIKTFILNGGIFFSVLLSSYLYAQDVRAPKWSISTGEPDVGDTGWCSLAIGLETGCFPAIADNGTIYVTNGFNGVLFAIAGDASLANTNWLKGMQNNSNNSRSGRE